MKIRPDEETDKKFVYQWISCNDRLSEDVPPKIIRCNNCKYYEGVHGTPGHAPCSFWKSGGVLWNDFCSNAQQY